MKLKSRNSLPSDKEARAGCLSLPANNGIIRTLPPPFYFTGMNIRLLAAFIFLSFSGMAAQASVYHCNSNGKSVYTSDPSGSCADADLPKISSHQGSGYRLKIRKLSQEAKIHTGNKKKNKKTAGKKNRQAAKAPKENQKQTTEKKSP
ncbi:TPA: DUF4124 domain-containing protein [Neisseria polysaccharea]|uniref:DUF4124 domain-containing protein n=1 Tax=Neisseria polysaccharea TaxID=489 RepID=UPI0026080DA2|nr:DUF4124 domain-containing protein [Neisseria polysaccharea]